MIADNQGNVNKSISTGKKTDEDNTKAFSNISLTKSDNARTFTVMVKPIKGDAEEVHVFSLELYQHLELISLMN